MRRLLILSCALLLSGCAVPLRSQEMLPQFDFYDQVKPKKFQDGIFIRNVDVTKGVGGVSPVTPEEYKAALVSAFRQADLYSKEEDAKYLLDATVVSMKQPFVGFNMTAETTTDYTIYRVSNNSVVYQDQLSLPCTKGVSDSFDGALRLRMASGCSVGENITHLIKVLSSQ